MEIFAQYGIAGVSLAIMFFMLKFFTGTMDKKDRYLQELVAKMDETSLEHRAAISEITDKYRETVNKYMKDGDESRRMQTRALQDLTVAVNTMNAIVCSNLNNKNDVGKNSAY